METTEAIEAEKWPTANHASKNAHDHQKRRGKKRGPKEGTVFMRSDGRWCGAISLGFRSSGRRKRAYIYGASQGEVLEKLTTRKNDLRLGLPITFEKQTVGQFLNYWLENSVKATLRPLTYQQYKQHVRLYLAPKRELNGVVEFSGLPALGRIQLSKLNPQQVQSFVNHQLKRRIESFRGRGGRRAGQGMEGKDKPQTLSPRTVQISFAILRRALGQALKWGLVARNVAKMVDPPRVERPETKPLTPDQARQFVQAIKECRWELIYLTALNLGLRESEVLGLRWNDIDLEKRTLTVNQSVQRIPSEKDGESSKLQLVELKTSRSRRCISIPASLAARLREHRTRQLRARLAAGTAWKDYGLVFTTSIGTAIEKSNLHRDFKGIIEKANESSAEEATLPFIRFHDLRHSTASLLLAQGVHPRAIMELLGHSRIGVTMDTYAHVMPAMMQDVADKMDSILANAK